MCNKMAAALLCGALLPPSGAGAQAMDYLVHKRLETAVIGLSDPLAADALKHDMAAIMVGAGLARGAPVAPDTATRDFVRQPGAVVEMVDIRLLLTQIAIQAGARDHSAIVRAQEREDQDVILLRGGHVTLTDLLSLSRGSPAHDFVTRTPRGIVLTRPLAIWSDAGLGLEDDDRLILDRPSGSFLVNLGWLDVSGGAIVGGLATNTAEPAFRPFVLTAGQGGITARAATFEALGFGGAAVFGGVAVVNNGLAAPRLASVIADSTLNDVTTLSLMGTKGAVLSANRVSASTGTAILVSHARDSVLAGNHLAELAGPQAIRVTAGASDVRISGNLLSGAARMGILIDGGSNDVAIENNLLVGSMTTGIAVEAATCITIVDNLVAANGGAGIRLADTDDAFAVNNAILFNHGSGVLLRDQAAAARVRVGGNVLVGNRDGLRGATPGNPALEGNDLDGQMPRIFAGDLASRTVDWLRNRRDALPVSIQSPSTASCAMQENG